MQQTPNSASLRLGGLRLARSERPIIGVIGTYRPRICGIATFTGDLVRAIQSDPSGPAIKVVALKTPGELLSYPSEVTSQIRQDVRRDYFEAADAMNRGHLTAVSLQHEFGIFGGDDGDLVVQLMEQMNAPIVTTLHTVLHEPTAHQRAVLRQVAALSAKVVVMSHTARKFLVDLYDIASGRIEVIPHGVPAQIFADSDAAKERVGLTGRKVVLTFGLLSPNKGIEYMIRALPEIAQQHPEVTYVVLGAGHPLALDDDSEPYVDGLKRRAAEANLLPNIMFITRFVELDELCSYLGAADVYVTPYVNEDQITSGTLSYALGSGIASVSTPYWHAKEMLADDRGRLVPFRDAPALSREVNALLADDASRQTMRRKAYEYSRGAVWEEVGRRYLDLLQSVAVRTGSRAGSGRELGASVA